MKLNTKIYIYIYTNKFLVHANLYSEILKEITALFYI